MIDWERVKKDLVYCSTSEENQIIYVSGFDTPGILSYIVGLISLQGLSIKNAKSHNLQYEDKQYFDDVFYIDFIESKKENWYEEIPHLIESQVKLIYKKKHRESQIQIINKFVEFVSSEKKELSPVIDIEINNKESMLEILVQGEDMPFLLYIISLSLEQQKQSIINFKINTFDSYVEDVFYIAEPKNFSKEDINKLRLSLLLNIQFLFLLQNSPDPYEAFIYFQELIISFEKEDISDMLSFLLSQENKKDKLATLLGSGEYLWSDFIRTQSSEVIKMLSSSHYVADKKIVLDEKSLVVALKASKDYEKKVEVLNEFKDKKIFEIDIENLMENNQDIKKLSIELSDLAKIIIRQASVLVEEKLAFLYGYPESSAGNKSDWVLFALGKLGGSALGYASDIELMFIYEDSGKTNGKNVINNREYFELFINEISKIIKTAHEGIFKIDLRLRPYGESGPKAVRLQNFIDYYSSDKAHSIELLALTRMRPITGNPRLAERVLRITKSILYQPHSINIESIFEMRKKQIQEKTKKNIKNAKFGLGALVDVEYCVQILQLSFGKDNLDLQQPSIHSAIEALWRIGEISEKESTYLGKAYMFFRKVINGLRVRRGNANDVNLPEAHTWELEHLARRIGYVSDNELSAGEKLIFDFDAYSMEVNNFTKKLFGELRKSLSDRITNPGEILYSDEDSSKFLLRSFSNAEQAYKSMHYCYKDEESKLLFSQILLLMWVRMIRRGDADLVILTFERIAEVLEKEALISLYKKLLKQPKSLSTLIDVFVTSRFLSEEIIKNPHYIDTILELKNMHEKKTLENYQENLEKMFSTGKNQAISQVEPKDQDALDEKNILRETRKIETLRIIIRDVCQQAPLPHICSEISSLAQALIQKSLSLACEKVGIDKSHIAILAFGKLGSRELNYSSDIDLMCVHDVSERHEQNKVKKIFQYTVKYLNEYTSGGIAYRIDLRLRPFGTSGDIITSKKSFIDYYKNYARLWEIQASLKLSFIAGDESFGEKISALLFFINTERLRHISPQEITQTIHELRQKSIAIHIKSVDEEYLEVKNSWGGIRDIEFSIQALLLIHYKEKLHKEKQTSLEALKVLRNKQYINDDTYKEIYENYLFLRRVEHFLQVYEDKQLHAIPRNDKIVKRRLAWLLLQEQDVDSFMEKLKKTKESVHKWYNEIIISGIETDEENKK